MRVVTAAVCGLVLVCSEHAKAAPDSPLAEPPTWSMALMSYAGIGLRSTDEAESHSVGGGLLRGQYSHFVLGGFFDVGESSANRHQRYGGLIGGYLPIRRWLDVELSLGISRRVYINEDNRFGPGGYEVHSPNLELRISLTDRAGGLLGGRIGAFLLLDTDLDAQNRDWSYQGVDSTSPPVTGTKQVGGTAFALLFTVGFDVTPQPDPAPAPTPAPQPRAAPAWHWRR